MNTGAVQRRTFQFRSLVFFVLLTLGVGLFGGFLGGAAGYEELRKPPLTPPSSVFPVVWTLLYTMMGIAAFIIYNANDIDSGKLLRIYLLQLFFNALWPIIFFRLKWRLFAFFWLVTLIALVSLVMAGFRYIRKTAYWLILPYFIWLIYAAYLNLGFYLLNR
jgi:benzodiazapine receptor